MTDSFPRQQARTRRFSLGVPRSFRISPDGRRVAFLRSRTGTDPVNCLWQLHLDSGQEELVADPATLNQDAADLPAAERARRERAREQAGGITAYATDSELNLAVFALGGRAYLARLTSPEGPARPEGPASAAGSATLASPIRDIGARSPVLDPRPDPAGRRIGYVTAGALHVLDPATGEDTVLADPGGAPGLSFGLAEFVAAEEMGRMRGYWWAPDGSAVLIARVDETPVQRWFIADPAHPDRTPAEVGYPAAGTPNAEVSLLLARLDGSQVEISWDRAAFPYLVTVDWETGDPLIVVQSRDQRRMRLLAADTASGTTRVLREDTDPRWVDIVPGVPARTSNDRIVWTVDADRARRLLVATAAEHTAGGATPVTPASLQVREVLSVDAGSVLFTASQADPAKIGLWLYRASPAGTISPSLTEITPADGLHAGHRSGGSTVVVSRTLAEPGPTVRVLRDSARTGQLAETARIASRAATPNLPPPHPDLFAAGPRQIPSALLLPSWHQPGSARLPVLLDPYGGPHAQRVLAAQGAFHTSQWLAEQGFAVLVADGRGTPGRGPEWEREVWRDLAAPVLDDQVTALQAAAERCADLDTSRVAIRGWSFGGYLAALAVLDRPDVFHAAVAGAPVTEWDLYDTHYTERYLGLPAENQAAYQHCSLIPRAYQLSRPLLIIHGLADDNVVVAHTLRLSSTLLAAGRSHSVLPLSGVTHMTPQEEVAENLLLLQVDFLRQALGMTGDPPGRTLRPATEARV
jgi:dipeptidyl-peptidase 4